MKNYIYCIVDQNGAIQKGEGSSNRTKFFEKRAQPEKWCEFYNKRHSDKRRVAKFELVEIPEDNTTPSSNTDYLDQDWDIK